jgi:hypothetical protein
MICVDDGGLILFFNVNSMHCMELPTLTHGERLILTQGRDERLHSLPKMCFQQILLNEMMMSMDSDDDAALDAPGPSLVASLVQELFSSSDALQEEPN